MDGEYWPYTTPVVVFEICIYNEIKETTTLMYDNYIIDDYFFGCLNSLFIWLLPTLSLLYISLFICHTHTYTHPNTLTHTRTHALLILYLTSYENVIHNNINQQIHMIVIPPPVLIPFLNQKFTFLHPDTLFSPSTSISPLNINFILFRSLLRPV